MPIFQIRNKNLFILATFLFLALAFYWFQYRPVKIRKECWEYADSRVKVKEDGVDLGKYTKAKDFVYKDCLRMKGLE